MTEVFFTVRAESDSGNVGKDLSFPQSSVFPLSNRHEVIGDPAIADAICDRIVHNAHKIELKGDSVRKIYPNN